LKCHKILGAVTFFSRVVFDRLLQFDFFDEVLKRTKHFKGDEFPDFCDYAVEEIIFPSAAGLFGRVGNLSLTNSDSPRYAVRFGNEVVSADISVETSIIHPIKRHDHAIHQHYRKDRVAFLECEDSFNE
jgi:hypothetical protein